MSVPQNPTTIPRPKGAKASLKFLTENFGPVAVFYGVNHFYGLRWAAVSTIVFCAIEVLNFRRKGEPMPKMFKFTVGMTLVFGTLDIIFAEGIFVRLEPVITNLITAGFFGYTIWSPESIIQMIAAQGGHTSSLDSPDKRFVFRVITGFWVLYFVGKAAVYLRYNFKSSIEEGLIFRTVAGNLSFFVMLGLSIVLARPLRTLLYKWGLMPSQRVRS